MLEQPGDLEGRGVWGVRMGTSIAHLNTWKRIVAVLLRRGRTIKVSLPKVPCHGGSRRRLELVHTRFDPVCLVGEEKDDYSKSTFEAWWGRC